MSADKLVDSTQLDADLTSVANAIRAKSGGSSQLAFPAGFVSEIGNISAGVEPKAVIFDRAFSLGDIELTSPLSLFEHCYAGRTGACSIIDYSSTNVPNNAFLNNTGITKYIGYEATQGGSNSFQGASNLQYIVCPKLALHYTYFASTCASLIGVDYGGSPTASQGFIRSAGYASDKKLKYMVLRGGTVWALSNIANFNDTPFASGKAGGILYVPADLISSYQAASNWSTILGYTNNQIKSIESTVTDPNAPVDLTTHYIDGTPIPTT